ncbi:MAG: hypothetical protein H0T79_06930, partial [Deltaproteobacteria bacterium]|nr:hypothetical protein [Deltaproteobacteria bacterium]
VDARLVDATTALPDAPTAVQVVTCPVGGNTPTVVTGAGTYSPVSTAIAVNEIVKFTMPSIHNVVPDPALMTDDGLNVGFNATRCLKFTVAGTYNFKCGPHQFKGNVVVN